MLWPCQWHVAAPAPAPGLASARSLTKVFLPCPAPTYTPTKIVPWCQNVNMLTQAWTMSMSLSKQKQVAHALFVGEGRFFHEKHGMHRNHLLGVVRLIRRGSACDWRYEVEIHRQKPHTSAISVPLAIVFWLRAIRIMTTYGSTIHHVVGEATQAVTQCKPYAE